MPLPIIDGLITYLADTTQLNASIWDGEVPRTDVNGFPINPDSTVTPSDWPVIKLYMDEAGFAREWTTEDPYTDLGRITIKVWATTRAQEEDLLNTIEAILAHATNWQSIILYSGPTPTNVPYVIHMLLKRWTSVQEEGVRTSKSELLYRGELEYEVMLHGAISTM